MTLLVPYITVTLDLIHDFQRSKFHDLINASFCYLINSKIRWEGTTDLLNLSSVANVSRPLSTVSDVPCGFEINMQYPPTQNVSHT